MGPNLAGRLVQLSKLLLSTQMFPLEKLVTALPAVLATIFMSPAHAVLVTNTSGFTSPIQFDFSDQPPGYTFTTGPVTVGASTGESITYTSSNISTNSGQGGVIGSGDYSLGGNGSWGDPFSFAGVDGTFDFITFTFNSNLVSAVGGFLNYFPNGGASPTISVYDSSDVLLESYDLEALAPISTPGEFNSGDFRGIMRNTSDIKSFRISNSYIIANSITFEPVPGEPVPGPLPILGVAAVFGYSRKLRKRIKSSKSSEIMSTII